VTVVANPLVDMTGALADLPVNILTNSDPARGLGSSIKKGVSHAKGERRGACLFVLGDQPFIRGQHLKDLIAKSKEAPESIIATAYPCGSMGVPALFPAVFFDDLLAIGDHMGAKEVIRSASGTVALAPKNDSLFDLDTPEDLAILMQIE
jgi:molybdenum cofactor cytidylyltransferase